MDPVGGPSPDRVDSPDVSTPAQPGVVPPTPAPPGTVPPASRSTSLRTVRLVGGLVALLILTMVAGCVGLVLWVGPPPDPRDGEEPGPLTFCCELAAPLRIAPVVRIDPGPCTGGSLPTRAAGDGCFVLDQGYMTVQSVERLSPVLDKGETDDRGDDRWVLELEFVDRDAAAFEQLTRQSVGKQLALVLDGRVLMAPQVAEPITGNELQISGNFTKYDVDTIFNQLTGG
ncbi:SecDF P1 head subdomain-containing protein [Cryptosporangium minutisporangium]|uniref:SecDF P1 head subdomain domain-containing protein n=1 Tax=Cryptosporangium minutisporangium TaxID=113569 RepID=A0ABP6SW85_9ACTN